MGQLKVAEEVWSGKELFSGERINRGLAALGLVPGGKLAYTALKGLGKTGSKVGLFGGKTAAVEEIVGTVANKSVTTADVKSPKLNSFEAKSNVLNTFKNGHVVEKSYSEGTRFYRIGDRNGAFWATKAPPPTELQMRYMANGITCLTFLLWIYQKVVP